MKKNLRPQWLCAALSFLMLVLTSFPSYAQEKVIYNETVDWNWTLPQTYGGNSFYWWHRIVDGYNINNLGEMPGDSWKSPADYENGTFYLRVEVISQPSANPFTIQLGIWQDIGKSGGHSECISNGVLLSGGAGSVREVSLGHPNDWWEIRTDAPVDYTRPEDFDRMGLILWKGSQECIPMAQGWSNSQSCGDAATQQANFFPMQVRITLVACASGTSFSGWSNYSGGGSTRHPTPNYAIDYTNERTNTVVPSTDEYSYSSNMSGAVSGNGTALNLSPGQDVYFRTKASGEILASLVQTLDVPSRPSAPTFAYDATNQRTSTTVSNQYEYSSSSDMSGAITGNGDYVNFASGTTRYFRKKATASAFKSTVQTLTGTFAGGVPTYQIDFGGEQTSANMSSLDEYSYNQSSWTTGNNSKLALTPGQDVYIRHKASPGEVQLLDVPSRPSAPAFAIDYINERTVATAGSDYQYSANADMSGATTGTGNYVTLLPGINTYFRKLSTPSTFKSSIQTLTVPNRQSVPAFTINFVNGTTMESIPSTVEYADNASFTSAVSGIGTVVPVSAGADMYFRNKATASLFKSSAQLVSVPAKPAAPAFAIDFTHERTTTTVSADYEYSSAADMSSPQSGVNSVVNVTPGNDLYFREKSTYSSFSSGIQHLVVPARPAAPTVTIDFAAEKTLENISETISYADNSDFQNAVSGTNAPVTVIPGQTLYFRVSPSAGSFSSAPVTLMAPARPVVTSALTSPTNITPIPVSIEFPSEVTGIESTDLLVTNGTVTSLTGSYEASITPTASGVVTVTVQPNAAAEGNFASEAYSITYSLPTGISDPATNGLKIYPTLVTGSLYVESKDCLGCGYRIYNAGGIPVVEGTIKNNKEEINIRTLATGSYYVVISLKDRSETLRFIKTDE